MNFPESGIERLEKNKEALAPLLSNHANIEKNISIYQNKLEEYKNSILSEEVYGLANELLDERSHYEYNLAQSEELSKEIEQSNDDINMALNDLAIPLNKETLKEINLPHYLTKTWNTLEEEAHQLNQIRNEIESEQQLLENELETLQTNINQLKQNLLPISELDKLKEQLFNYSHTSKQVNDLQEQSTDQNLKKRSEERRVGKESRNRKTRNS